MIRTKYKYFIEVSRATHKKVIATIKYFYYVIVTLNIFEAFLESTTKKAQKNEGILFRFPE